MASRCPFLSIDNLVRKHILRSAAGLRGQAGREVSSDTADRHTVTELREARGGTSKTSER